MDKKQFEIEYLGEWIQTKEQEKAYELWLYYYYLTEIFDQSVCYVKDKYGIAIPTTLEERKLTNLNSKSIYDYIHLKKKEWERLNNTIISKEDWKSPKNYLNRLTLKGLEQEYNRIFN